MRIYEGSPRQDFEEVFRSIGAFLDQRGMRDVLLARGARRVHRPGPGHRPGAAAAPGPTPIGTQVKETLTFLDDDIARFMEEAAPRRGGRTPTPPHEAGHYETAFRVIGRYIDEQKPHDVFFFEQDGAFVLRLLMAGSRRAGSHQLAEFTRDDIDGLVARGPSLRHVDETAAR